MLNCLKSNNQALLRVFILFLHEDCLKPKKIKQFVIVIYRLIWHHYDNSNVKYVNIRLHSIMLNWEISSQDLFVK